MGRYSFYYYSYISLTINEGFYVINLLDSRFDKAVLQIKEDEGFRGNPYDDTLGYPTVGYGTKLPLTKGEAVMLLRLRLSQMLDRLQDNRPILKHLPIEAQNIIANMCYQLGDAGVNKFNKFWKALEDWDFKTASLEMLYKDSSQAQWSLWHTQTPDRCERLAEEMYKIGEKYEE